MKHATLGNRVVKLYPDLSRYCRSLCRSREDAEDLCHSAIARVLASGYSDEKGNNLKGYLFRSALNLHLNTLKSSSHRNLVLVEQLNEGFTVPGSSFDHDVIMKSIDELTQKHREVMQLLIAGYGYHEIAERKDLNIGTVKSIIFYSRNKLRKVYGQDLN